ncbi:MAG TPA: hypothetical protein VFQ51_19625 [Vicinamibacteria bacterium]|nr:hypothetical protein [Vicinamibacteria bacterium]
MRLAPFLAVPALVLLASCGGDKGATPSGTGSSSRLGAGAVLTVVSGETGGPVAGATLTIGSQVLTSDGAGAVRLAAAAPIGTTIDIVHPAYLDRLTTVRSATSLRFALWPKATSQGLSEHYTATIVYTAADEPGTTGDSALTRLPRGASTVVVVPGPDLLSDAAAMDAHSRAAAALTEATGGAVTYTVSANRPSAGVVVTTRVDPSDSRCVEGGIRAYTRSTYQGQELQSAQVIFCSFGVSRSATIGHELGHTFGLRHSPDARDLMYFQFAQGRATTFGPRESLVMRLMLDRPAGNRYPDNDRTASGSAATSERITVCY